MEDCRETELDGGPGIDQPMMDPNPVDNVLYLADSYKVCQWF